MPERMDYLELDTDRMEVAGIKNEFIRDGKAPWICLGNGESADKEYVLELMENSGLLLEYQAVVLADAIGKGGRMDLTEVLRHPDIKIAALAVQRKLLEKTGSFHEQLAALNTYEFLCRIAEETVVYGMPCKKETMDREAALDKSSALTLAYIARRNMVTLKSEGSLEEIFSGFALYMMKQKLDSEFYTAMDRMLNHPQEYEELAADTAPFLVLVGDDTCYSVLRRFAHLLSDALAAAGQAVVTTDGRHGVWSVGEGSTVFPILKGVIGFQMKVLERDIFRRMRCPKYQFWFDHPVYFDDMLHNLPTEYYILCQDSDYADYIRKYCHTENAIQFPPAGEDAGYAGCLERPYDVVFIGSYWKPWSMAGFTQEERQFYDFMIAHPDRNFEAGYRQYLREEGNDHAMDGQDDMEIVGTGLGKLQNVCRAVTAYYRDKVVETLLQAGIAIHVYGDSWENCHTEYDEYLVRHPKISVEESLEVLGKAKVGLNLMAWHKAGMTERIANIMLSGAVCVSEDTEYLRRNYTDGEEMILFKLSELANLPQRIRQLLQEEEMRRQIAAGAYRRAIKEHTWQQRARELLALYAGRNGLSE